MYWYDKMKNAFGFYKFCIVITGVAAFVFRILGDNEASIACFVAFVLGVGIYAFGEGIKFLHPTT